MNFSSEQISEKLLKCQIERLEQANDYQLFDFQPDGAFSDSCETLIQTPQPILDIPLDSDKFYDLEAIILDEQARAKLSDATGANSYFPIELMTGIPSEIELKDDLNLENEEQDICCFEDYVMSEISSQNDLEATSSIQSIPARNLRKRSIKINFEELSDDFSSVDDKSSTFKTFNFDKDRKQRRGRNPKKLIQNKSIISDFLNSYVKSECQRLEPTPERQIRADIFKIKIVRAVSKFCLAMFTSKIKSSFIRMNDYKSREIEKYEPTYKLAFKSTLTLLNQYGLIEEDIDEEKYYLGFITLRLPPTKCVDIAKSLGRRKLVTNLLKYRSGTSIRINPIFKPLLQLFQLIAREEDLIQLMAMIDDLISDLDNQEKSTSSLTNFTNSN